MKIVVFLSLFVSLVAVPAVGQSQRQVLDELDAYLGRTSRYMGNCPYAVVVSKNGEIIHEHYYDGGGVVGPVDKDTKWQFFSITKSFVAALVLNLVRDRTIGLDDPISKYLPTFGTHGDGTFDRRDVTIRHLASHTSGAAYDGEGLPDDLNDVTIETKPGETFLYSGLGMHLLELTLEAATGKDLDDLMQERVIKPLGLSSVGYVYDEDDPGGPVLPVRPGRYVFISRGNRAGSGLSGTARDLNAFGVFWMNPDRLFTKDLRAEAWKHHGTRDLDNGDYGLLWWLFADHGGYVMSGYGQKVNAVVPETGVVITVIRYTQNNDYFEFSADKHAFVTFASRL